MPVAGYALEAQALRIPLRRSTSHSVRYDSDDSTLATCKLLLRVSRSLTNPNVVQLHLKARRLRLYSQFNGQIRSPLFDGPKRHDD
jgi:hypothetical protein